MVFGAEPVEGRWILSDFGSVEEKEQFVPRLCVEGERLELCEFRGVWLSLAMQGQWRVDAL